MSDNKPSGNFPGDLPIPGIPHRSSDYSSTDNRKMELPKSPARKAIPTDPVVVTTSEVENDGGSVVAVERTRETASRNYNASMIAVPAPSTTWTGGDPVMLVGQDWQRSRVCLTNGSSTDTVLIGPLASIANGTGFILPPLTMFEAEVQEPVYACTPVGAVTAITVGVWVERD